jgi:DNA-binding MarR family transcriptional regulator
MTSGKAEKIYELMQKFQKMRMNANSEGEIPRSELKMLKMIRMNSTEAEGVKISTLSELLNISKSAVSQMINALEDKGYVERVTTKNDRRVVYVRLTGDGEACFTKQIQAFLHGMDKIFAKMGEEDTEELLRLLEKLYTIVSEPR